MVGKLQQHQDPIGVVLSSVVGVLGVFGVLSALGLTADDVAELLGFAMAGVAALRTRSERRKHSEVQDLRDRLEFQLTASDETKRRAARQYMEGAHDPDDPVRSPPAHVEDDTPDSEVE